MWFSKIKLGGLSLLGEDSIYGGRIEGLLDSNSQHNESALITDGSKKGLSKKEPLTISLSLILKENISSIKAFNNFVQLNYILNQDNIMLEYVLFNDNKYYNLEVNKESISYSEDYNLINIVLKAFNPFIYKRDEKNLELELEIEGGYSFPVNGYSFPNEHIFNETIIGNTGIIYNDGFNTIYPVIEIVGEINNISIKNNTTGEELKINSNLNTGEMLIVDCRKETRSIIKIDATGEEVNYLKHKSGVWLSLKNAENEISIKCDGAAQVNIKWKECY